MGRFAIYYHEPFAFFEDTPEVLLSNETDLGHFIDAALLKVDYWGCVSALSAFAPALTLDARQTPLSVRIVTGAGC